jgi:hypothetical protein
MAKLITSEGEIIHVLGDGHCLFRSIGKILQIQPAEIMRMAKLHMMATNMEGPHYISQEERDMREVRYKEFENVQNNVEGPDIHQSEWGGIEDYQVVARWSKRYVVRLNMDTDRCTVIPCDLRLISAVSYEACARVLRWLRDPSCITQATLRPSPKAKSMDFGLYYDG